MSKKATEDALNALHAKLASALADRIEKGEEEITREGEVVHVACKPATLAVAVKFLKDNGIEGAHRDTEEGRAELAARLRRAAAEDDMGDPFGAHH